MARNGEPIRPMTLGSVRRDGVRGSFVPALRRGSKLFGGTSSIGDRQSVAGPKLPALRHHPAATRRV